MTEHSIDSDQADAGSGPADAASEPGATNSAPAAAGSGIARRRLVPLVALLLPTVLAAALVAVFLGEADGWGADAERDGQRPMVSAAVVNNDEPVELEGELVPLGRQLVAELVNSDDPLVDWTLSDEADADAGLESGDYSVVATIPENFSAAGTSAASEDGAEARTAQIAVERTEADRVADELATRSILQSALRSVGDLVTGSFLDNVFIGFTEMNDQLGEAAVGADELADGVLSLRDGSGELQSGTQMLSDNVPELVHGAGELSGGANELSGAAGELADGMSEISAGADELSAGLDEIAAETGQLPEQSRQLADGAEQVADGVELLNSMVAPATTAALSTLESVPDVTSSVEQLRSISDRCSGEPVCAELAGLVDTLSADVEQSEGGAAEAREAISSLRDDVGLLSTGARQVADGAGELADAAPELSAGIGIASAGAGELAEGLGTAEEGAGALADGAGQLADGADELTGGVMMAGEGITELNDGALALRDGSGVAAEGADELAYGLGTAVDELPDYVEDETEHLARTLTSPVDEVAFDSSAVGASLAALLGVLLLWASSALYFLYTRALPDGLSTAAGTTGRLLREGLPAGILVAVLQAMVVTAMLAVVLAPGVGVLLAAFVVASLASVMFTGVNRAVAGVFPRGGIVIATGVAVIAFLAGMTSLAPASVQDLAEFLPTGPALTAVQGALLADAGTVFRGIVGILAWTGVAVGAVWIIAERTRSSANARSLARV